MTRIIKRGGILKPEYLRALETAGQVMEAGERNARLLEASAEQKARAVLEEARSQGRAEAMAMAAAMLVEAETRRARWIEAARTDLVDLAIEVGRALHQRVSTLDPRIAEDLCREAAGKFAMARRVTIRVAPGDEPLLRGFASDDRLAISLVADPGLDPGGCLVESEAGTIDATVETRVEMLRQALDDVVGRLRERSPGEEQK